MSIFVITINYEKDYLDKRNCRGYKYRITIYRITHSDAIRSVFYSTRTFFLRYTFLFTGPKIVRKCAVFRLLY